MTLREQVEQLLPSWESWYPSLFDAAVDLGVLKAQVCSPSSLLLSRRHSSIQSDAVQTHRENWGGVLPDVATPLNGKSKGKRRRRGRGKKARGPSS